MCVFHQSRILLSLVGWTALDENRQLNASQEWLMDKTGHSTLQEIANSTEWKAVGQQRTTEP